MRPSFLAFALAVLALMPPAAEGSQEDWAPTDVVTASTPSGAFVTWGPGTQVADQYKVYGVNGSHPVFLQFADQPFFELDPSASFPSYAVSGVKNGAESEIVYAVGVPCLSIRTDPPDVYLDECEVYVPIRVGKP